MDKLIVNTMNIIGNTMYCLCGNYNCIIGIRLNDCKVEYVGCLKNEYTFQVDLSISSLVLGNCILYVPGYSRNMHYFDVSKKEDTIEMKIVTAGSCLMYDVSDTLFQDENIPFCSDSLYGIAKITENTLVQFYRKKNIFACTAILYNHESHRRAS